MKKADITAALVSELAAAQFPQWAHLPVMPIENGGWDNATFRLGADMSVRLPSAESYVKQVDKEHRWLPVLARSLPLPIPRPLAKGVPGPPAVYDGQAKEALAALRGHIDTELASEVWQAALGATWHGDPVWFHGDAQPGNLLVRHRRLSAVIDFGSSGVGDPACDTTIAGKGRATRIASRARESSRGCWHVIQPREGALH